MKIKTPYPLTKEKYGVAKSSEKIMARNRLKSKGREKCASFVMLRHDVMRHENFSALSPHATKLLIDLLSQYNGKNNGDLSMPWSTMQQRGWNSKSTLYAARDELLHRGWIVKTRQGGKHVASLYAVTWLGIDQCDGKLDAGWHESSIPLNLWRGEIKKRAPNMDHISTPTVPIDKLRVVK